MPNQPFRQQAVRARTDRQAPDRHAVGVLNVAVMNEKVNLAAKLALLDKPHEPGIVGFINPISLGFAAGSPVRREADIRRCSRCSTCSISTDNRFARSPMPSDVRCL